MGCEPIIALSFVEDDLQGAESQGHKAQADVVDGGFFKLAAFEIRRVLNEP